MMIVNKKFWGVPLLLIAGVAMQAQVFYFGADLSYVNEMEDCGANYKVNNTATDPYQIFNDNGTNLVRLRLWHTPSWYDNLNAGNRYSDFADVRKSILRAHAQEMEVLLDFHLSDNWADPSKQVAPQSWALILDNLPVLQDSLYNYVYGTLNRLAAENLLPEMVQIGNETNRGILLSQEVNDAGWTLDWERNSALFNTAISAIRDIEVLYQTEIDIAIHIADPSSVGWYIEQFVDHGVIDFDVIGISYYWQWHDDSFEEVGNVISSLKDIYPEKEVMIFETAYPWTTANVDGANNLLSVSYPGYSPFSPAIQKDWMIDLTQTVIDYGGSGIVYWEPGWVSTDCRTQWAQGSHWDNAIFFDGEHDLIEDGGIMWMLHAYNFPTSAYDPNSFPPGIEILHSGNEILIRRSDKFLLNSELEIDYYMIDGKIIDHQSVYPVWENSLCRLPMPDFTGGCYIIKISSDHQFVAAKLIFRE